MNLFDVGLGCNEQCPEHRHTVLISEIDVVIVRPPARTLVVDGAAELHRDGCTDRPRIGVRFEVQHGLMNMRRAFGIHEPEGSAT